MDHSTLLRQHLNLNLLLSQTCLRYNPISNSNKSLHQRLKIKIKLIKVLKEAKVMLGRKVPIQREGKLGSIRRHNHRLFPLNKKWCSDHGMIPKILHKVQIVIKSLLQ